MARSASLMVVAIGVVAIVCFGLLSSARLNAPSLRATIDTGAVSIGLAAAWEARAWMRGPVRLSDLLLAVGLLTLVLTWLVADALPAVLALHSGAALAAIEPFGVGAGALVLAAGVRASDRLLPGGSRWDLVAVGASLAALGVATVSGLTIGSAVIGPDVNAGSPFHVLTGQPLALALALLAAGPLGYVAAVTARRARGRAGTVDGLLACGLIVLAGASCSSPAVIPGSGWVTPGVALRLLGAGLVLTAVLRRNREARSGLARAAALAERQRIARDLHDGLAQELAFIAAHGARIAEESGAEHPVAIAARRALAISRGTISDLTDLSGMPLSDALAVLSHELGSRFEIAIDVAVPIELVLPEEVCVDLVRITREAIANAARHGGARTVTLSTHRAGAGAVLRIRDDGTGRREGSREGFGVGSMRDRAIALGGELTIRDLNGGGTELEVGLP